MQNAMTNEQYETLIAQTTNDFFKKSNCKNKLEVIDVELEDVGEYNHNDLITCNILIREYFDAIKLNDSNDNECEVSFNITWSVYTRDIEIDHEERVVNFESFESQDEYGIEFISASNSEEEFKEKISFGSSYLSKIKAMSNVNYLKYVQNF